MSKDSIMKNHPSICYTCINARNPVSVKLLEDGYVGCCVRVLGVKNPDVKKGRLYEGWVDLRASVFSEKSSGIQTNSQLLTIEVSDCSYYKEDI